MKKVRGFTLVELIIVIAVIGVLAAILIPVFANVIDKANQKSALSDATNAIKAYIAEVTTEEGVQIPNIIAAVHKGNKVYTCILTDNDGIIPIEGVVKVYSDVHGIDGCAMAVITQLEADGYITPDINSLPDPNGVLERLDYDVINSIYLDASYVLDNNAVISDATMSDSMDGVPTPPPRTPIPVAPTFDSTTETYTFTITSNNITRNMAIPNEADAAAYGVALSFDAIIESCARNMATQNWYGYDVRIINNSGRSIDLSKVVINVPSDATGFVCSFIGTDSEGETDFAAFRDNLGSATALNAGENVIAASDIHLSIVSGSNISGAFMLGYTGGGNPSDNARDAIGDSTVILYYKNA